MKKVLFVLFILFSLISSKTNAQTQEWIWAHSLTGISTEKSHSIVQDKSKNLLITGAFASSNLSFGTNTITSQGSYDVFVAKYDTLGNNIWAFSIGGSGEDEAWDIITDNLNNIYVTGWFKSSDFYIGTDTVLHNTGQGTMFLVKYDTDGNFLWAKNSIGNGREWGRALGVDDQNNVYLGGNFIGGNITISDSTFINQGSYDMYIAKFKFNGEMQWAKHTGGSETELLRNLAVNPYGDVYIVGDFSSNTIIFDTISLVNSSSYRDNFVVRYNSGGNVVWVKQITGSGEELGSFIAVDWKENIYVTGQFGSSTCNFDSLQLTNSSSSKEVYLVKYDYYGEVKWVNAIYGENDDIAYSISSDMSNGLYLCGWFNSSDFGVGSDVLSSVGGYDIFVSKFDFSGDYYWTKQTGGTNDDYAECIVSDENGNLYVTGKFNSNTVDFDDITLNNSGSDDVFISKLIFNDETYSNHINTNDIKIYPNPVCNQLVIENKDLLIEGVELFNITGKTINKFSFTDTQIRIDFSKYEKGIYLIKIKLTDGSYVNYKIMKE